MDTCRETSLSCVSPSDLLLYDAVVFMKWLSPLVRVGPFLLIMSIFQPGLRESNMGNVESLGVKTGHLCPVTSSPVFWCFLSVRDSCLDGMLVESFPTDLICGCCF